MNTIKNKSARAQPAGPSSAGQRRLAGAAPRQPLAGAAPRQPRSRSIADATEGQPSGRPFFFADANQVLACAAAAPRPFSSLIFPFVRLIKNDSAPSQGSFELEQPHG